MRVWIGLAALAGASALGASGVAQAQTAAPDGARLFADHCASCHEHPQGRMPSRESLGNRPASGIRIALSAGAMKVQGAGLSSAEVGAIAEFLTAEAAAKMAPLKANPCTRPLSPLAIKATDWNGWGRDTANSRYQPRAGLSAAELPRLKLKWAFAYPGAMVWGQPTVVGGRVFVASTTGQVFSLDAASGCTIWTFEAAAPVRTALSIGPGSGGGKTIAYFGDTTGVVYALDAESGHELWRRKMDTHPMARITGAPALYNGRLYVPVSSFEEPAAAVASYHCCTFRGSVAALDAATGAVVWQTYTVPGAPKPYRREGDPTGLFGPAGGAVWNTPTIDAKRGVLYVGTGNDYTDIDTPRTDAVLAIELKSGKVVWSRQLLPLDHWVAGCTTGGRCPENAGPDYDINISPILVTLKSGRQVLAAGQKSGFVYGLDPDARGKQLWKTKFGTGGIFGGIEWGMAAAGQAVFAPISDSLTDAGHPPQSGLGAVDAATGKTLWWTPAPKPACNWGEAGCKGAQSQAASAIPGVALSGSHDGHLRGYRISDGKVIWDFDTAAKVTPVNAASAAGGSLDAGGPTVSDGVLYVNSGYGQFFGRGGNVLLALSVDGK